MVLVLDDSTRWLGDMLSDSSITDGVVFAACDVPADWPALEQRLVDALRVAKRCAVERKPLVFLVHCADVRGIRTVLASSLSTALISCARTVAFEFAHEQLSVNVVALTDDGDRAKSARVVRWLLDDPALTGELVDLGSAKFGRLQP